MNNKTWKFRNGVQLFDCSTFPYAFRMMYSTLKKAEGQGKSESEITKSFKILSPVGTEYSFAKAMELASQQGLIDRDGNINSKEFKQKQSN